ncbi:MAG: TIGR03084 family metal-binding protein [Acidimicrobiia bacterium]|nr:MAG: TIGR03084 family metal-binding protein [Acidimicrobiia bacterium]
MASGEYVKQIVSDLRAEQDSLDDIVSRINRDAWSTPTPAEGWDVRDQIGHLTFFDERATEAVANPEAFLAGIQAASADIDGYMVSHLDVARQSEPAEVLSHWRRGRSAVLDALAQLDPSTRLAWYGPPMSARSFATARLMETWAHGQDIVDGLKVNRTPTDRLRHIAFLGVRTMGWSFTVNGRDVPAEAVRISLTTPSGDRWLWNEDSTRNIVSGPAEDFCLVVTQRRHILDTGLEVTGSVAEEWMSIAQAFAGPPGEGRRAGMFS